MARNIAPFVRSYVGVEASLAMIDEGRQGGLDVRHGDMMAMPFDTGSVDAVIEHESIDFCGEPLLAATEIERVLASGGHFYRIELETAPGAEISRLQEQIITRLAEVSGGVFPYWTRGSGSACTSGWCAADSCIAGLSSRDGRRNGPCATGCRAW